MMISPLNTPEPVYCICSADPSCSPWEWCVCVQYSWDSMCLTASANANAKRICSWIREDIVNKHRVTYHIKIYEIVDYFQSNLLKLSISFDLYIASTSISRQADGRRITKSRCQIKLHVKYISQSNKWNYIHRFHIFYLSK